MIFKFTFIGRFLLTLITLFNFLNAQNIQNKLIQGYSSYSSKAISDSETQLIRCMSTEYEDYLRQKYSERSSEKDFERWLAPKVDEMRKILRFKQQSDNVIIIPVVVHVVHRGTPLGIAANITDERVFSQISVLNQDFRKMLNTPGYNTNPVGADIEVEFRLAKVDPQGNTTNGIDRVLRTGISWNKNNIENILKPQTQWDPNSYFNIWVLDLEGDLSNVLGYAQFPSNSGLQGISGTFLEKTDGIVVAWRAFGSSSLAPGVYYSGFDLGRTLTHEMGHALGLRHIWGDNSSCIVNSTDSNKDYCLDTPAASRPNLVCSVVDSCPSDPGNDMVENYMDYTFDNCMNIFTQDQKTRMLAVLQNSPRRKSLVNSMVWKDEMPLTAKQISTYPNPARNELYVSFQNTDEYPISYSIYSSTGAFLAEVQVQNKERIRVNTSDYIPGVYFMKLVTNKKNKEIRFVVIK